MQKLILLFLAVSSGVQSAAPNNNVIRPCDLSDYRCIRDNLAANSRCNPGVRGSVPRQYTIKRLAFETPYFNASYIDNNLQVINLDKCFVSEFFYNVANDKAVLAIDCPRLNFISDRTLIQHYSLREDTTYSYKINGVYPLIRLTTNLPRADEMDLCNSYTFADVTALPIFNVNPNDMPTQKFLSKDLSYMNIYERETFFYRAKNLFRYFINSVICDFGCNA